MYRKPRKHNEAFLLPVRIAMKMEHYSAEDHIEVRDLGLASALISVGCNLVSHKRTKVGRVYFIFKNNEDLQAASSDWQKYELVVNARIYFETTKKLKDIIYAERFS